MSDDFFMQMTSDEFRDYRTRQASNRNRQRRQIVYAFTDSPGLWYESREAAMTENPDRDPDTLEKFDSRTEYRRFCELHTLQRAGEISDLECHPTFILSDAQNIRFTPDFQYTENGRAVIEDVKAVDSAGKKLVWEAARIKHAWFQDKFPRYEFRLTTA